jgi:hypothetical protein
MPRLEGIHANLVDRLREAKGRAGWARSPRSRPPLAAAEQMLIAMRSAATQHTTTTLGMPGFGPAIARSSFNG